MSRDHLLLQDGASPLNRRLSPPWSVASVASVPCSGTASPRRTRRAQPTASQVLRQYPSPVSLPLHFPPFCTFLFLAPAYTLPSEYVKSAESKTPAVMSPSWPRILRNTGTESLRPASPSAITSRASPILASPRQRNLADRRKPYPQKVLFTRWHLTWT